MCACRCHRRCRGSSSCWLNARTLRLDFADDATDAPAEHPARELSAAPDVHLNMALHALLPDGRHALQCIDLSSGVDDSSGDRRGRRLLKNFAGDSQLVCDARRLLRVHVQQAVALAQERAAIPRTTSK